MTETAAIEREAPARVLVADDDESVRLLMGRILSTNGHEVVLAHDGEEALQLYSQSTIDLIVSDISMPRMDGLTLLRRVREDNEDIPFILLAGAPSADTAIDALRFHATEYLPKPIRPEQLLQSVLHALGLNRLAKMRREALSLYRKHSSAHGEATRRSATFSRALDALYMVYQPITSWSKRKVFGYEALVRSSETELPHPGALFDAAEELDRLFDLGRQIRAKCVEPLARAESDTSLFVNLHTEDLLDETLFDSERMLARNAHRVILEITERAKLEKIGNVQNRIARLRELGFRIAIDDIGAGYSGLNSFAMIQPDIVKLDITLVRGVEADAVKRKLVRVLTDLCHDLNIVVVAEGVETVAERDTLVDLGCDLFQGYLFARPGAPFPEPKF
ncbi:MAG TPA: EAL domain-containing protein [Polyangiales bacterium]|nr:EAL domain-containing protein [Polyangiales bacterium]